MRVSRGGRRSGNLVSAIAGQPRPIVDLSHVAELSKALAVLLDASHAVRDLEADLGRLSGRLSHLFTVDYERASEHRAEIHATLDETRALLRKIPIEIAALHTAIADPLTEIARILRYVAAELGA